MNMIVGTAVMTATASKVNAEGSSIDAELVALSEKVLELLPAYEAAAKRAGEIYDEFEKLAPVRDAALLWRLGDPIGFVTEDLPNGRSRLWCNGYHINKRRRVQQGTWHFRGTDADRARLTDDDFLLVENDPKPHVRHLFEKIPNKRLQNRFNKILAAWDAYTSACEALRTKLGLREVEDYSCELYNPIADMVERIELLEARTLAGVRAKALILLHWHWAGRDTEDLDDLERLTADIVEGLIAAKITA